jgi:hypothetical protein
VTRCAFRVIVTLTLIVFVAGLSISQPVFSHDHGKIRMYKLNKKGQPIRQKWLKDTDEEGCHSSFKARKVFRFAQVGFRYCVLYSGKNCVVGSEVSATWGGKKYKNAKFDIDEPQTKLVKGTEWFLSQDENMEINSWYCEYSQD